MTVFGQLGSLTTQAVIPLELDPDGSEGDADS